MTTKIITIKMKANKSPKVYFNTTLQNVKEIQLVEYHNQFEGFMLFCDIIDPYFSFSNISEMKPGDYVNLNPSKLLAIFSDTKLYPKIPIQNKWELSNLTLEITNENRKPPDFDETETLVLEIHCF